MDIRARSPWEIPRQWFSRALRPGLVQNVLALYGVQVVNYLLPLVLVPYLARVLGPSRWGQVAFAQAFAAYVMLVVDYGYNLSGTREAARQRDSRDRLAELFAEILAARGMLAVASLSVALAAAVFIPGLRDQPVYLAGGLLWALALGFQLSWYFQGLERMRLVAGLTVVGRAVGAISIFLLVRNPNDGWKVLLLQGTAYLIPTIVGLGFVYGQIPFRWPSARGGWKALRLGWTLFLNEGALSLYATANTVILGIVAPVQAVAYFAGAEKITKALIDVLVSPVSWAVFPRLSHLVQHARGEAIRLARYLVLVTLAGGVTMGLALFLAAPIIVRVLLGSNFGPAVPVLRILAFLPPITAAGWSLANWMLTQGMDRAVTAFTASLGVVNVAAALLLGPRFAQQGVAWALVIANALGLVVIYALLRWRRLDPITMSV